MTKPTLLTAVAALMSLSLPLLAADKTPSPSGTPGQPSPEALKKHIEMHEQIAAAHQGAADCLKAGKPMQECRSQFMKAMEKVRASHPEMEHMDKKHHGREHGMAHGGMDDSGGGH